MFNRFQRLCSGLLVLALFPGAVVGEGHSQGNPHKQKDQAQRDDRDEEREHPAQGAIIFSRHDCDVIREYYRVNTANLPPGLAKRGGNLPPGLQKHLERDGTLPPGLQKRVAPFPPELERRLPRLPDIYTRGSIGDAIVILDRKTQKIIDIVHDIMTLP